MRQLKTDEQILALREERDKFIAQIADKYQLMTAAANRAHYQSDYFQESSLLYKAEYEKLLQPAVPGEADANEKPEFRETRMGKFSNEGKLHEYTKQTLAAEYPADP